MAGRLFIVPNDTGHSEHRHTRPRETAEGIVTTSPAGPSVCIGSGADEEADDIQSRGFYVTLRRASSPA